MRDFPSIKKWANPDGSLTVEARLWIAALLRELATAEAALADHEARLVVLE